MNRRQILVSGLVLVVIVTGLLGCTPTPGPQGTAGDPPKVSVTSISLDKDKVTLEGIGTLFQLNATVSPPNATNQNVTWKSLDPGVATVDRGYIKSIAAGTTTIVVSSEDGGKLATCEVTVKLPATGGSTPPTPPTGNTGSSTPTGPSGGSTTPAKVVPTGVTLNKTALSMTPQSPAETLVATISPANADNKSLTWVSSSPRVASVTAEGVVQPLAKGSTTITVTTQEGGFSAQCTVTVSGTRPTGLSLDLNSLTLTTEDSPVQLTAVVLPEDAEDKTVNWTTTHSLVAMVSQQGLVTPVAKGTATIRATTSTGGFTAECVVTVTAVVPQGITLDKDRLTLLLGSSPYTLSATVLPSSAENKAVTWASSKPSVATVDSAGKVTQVAEGTATITATTVEGGLSAVCEVSVVKLVIKPINPIVIGPVKVTGISLDKDTLHMTKGGLSYDLVPAIEPSHATNKNVSWVSSNTAVATVTSAGRVTPVGTGTAVIKATTADGGFTAACTVEVETPNTSGATAGNIANGSMIAFQGNWIYFSGTSDSNTRNLYKMRLDGSEVTLLTSDEAVSINVVGDWVYYLSNKALYRIRTDGTQRTLLNSIDAVVNPHVVGSTIYYISNGSIYRMSTAGTSRTKISDESSVAKIVVFGNQIFYTKHVPGEDYDCKGIYRMNLDGSGKATITSDRIEGYRFLLDDNGQTVYYLQYNPEALNKKNLYSIRIDGSNKKKLGTDYYTRLNVSGGYIYYVLWTAMGNVQLDKGTHRMRTDGTLSMRISSNDWSLLYVNGDYVYYRYIYRVNKDGTGQVRLK
jgi:uncharacterized protein YjdB